MQVFFVFFLLTLPGAHSPSIYLSDLVI